MTYDGNPTNYDLRLYVIENSLKVGIRLQTEEGETLVTYLLNQGDEEGTLSLYQEIQIGALEFVKTLTKKAS